MVKVLYMSYWGALEPLGQSLILPAVVKLSQMGAEITLVTFDKPNDLAKKDEVKRVRLMLEEAGIEWFALKYNAGSAKTPFDIARGIACGIGRRLDKKFDIVHGRTYVGGLIGLALAPMIGAKFVYHNEGFYPDEQVDGGVWVYHSRSHRLAKRLETLMYARADGIIALSNRAKAEIENLPAVEGRQTPVIFVPSCVDLERFKFAKSEPVERDGEKLKFVYIGSVGARYTLDNIGRLVSAINREENRVQLQIYSKADPQLIKKMLMDGGVSESAYQLSAVPHAEMPAHLARHDVGLFSLTQGISEHGCSPTKIGEYWAVGLPVITTPNVSDTDEIIRRENVGVILESQTDDAYRDAFRRIQELSKDPELAARCRRAAEEHYSLLPACARQMSLYEELAKN